MDRIQIPAGADSPYAYAGPEALRQPIEAALRRVVDPEVAMSIVDLGLVYGVAVGDVEAELDRVVPPQMTMHVDLVREPAWTPDRMSERARSFMGW